MERWLNSIHAWMRGLDFSGLRRRIILSFLFVALLPVVLLMVFTRDSIVQLFLQEYIDTLQTTVGDFAMQADTYLTSLRRLPAPIYSNETYTDLLLGKGGGVDVHNRLISSVHMLFINNPEIQRMRFYTRYDASLWEVSKRTANPFTLVNVPPPLVYIPRETPVYTLMPSETAADGEGTFISRQVITDIPRNNLLAILRMDIGPEALDKLLTNVPLYENEMIGLLNEERQPLYTHGSIPFAKDRLAGVLPADLPALSAPQRCTLDGEEYVLYVKKLTHHDVYALRIVSYSHLVQRASTAIGRTLWMYGLFAGVAALFGLLLSLRITKPLNLLVSSMKRVGRGRFGEHIDVNIADSELRMLFERFNTMTDQINQLFRETYQLRLAQQTAELKALQSQINPHFLYNTLQTVHYMALKRNAYEINMIVDALSSMLKYCLSSGSDAVTLAEELSMIDQYLTIQQARFMERLSVQLEIEEGVKALRIPRMTLQPLVENSVQHGIQESTSLCTVRVRCFAEGAVFWIIVSDDGVGMDAQRLSQVRESLHDEADSLYSGSHIGLRNCWLRLRLLLKDAVQIHIESSVGSGTTVCIRIDQTDIPSGGEGQ